MKRKLYSDGAIAKLHLHCSVLLNGITEVATQADLLQRSILLQMSCIPESQRKTEKEVWQGFHRDMPKILGSCFSALSKAMALRGTFALPPLTRMADFMEWGCCIASAIGREPLDFYNAYLENLQKAQSETILSKPECECLRYFLMNRPAHKWTGTWSDLRKMLLDTANAHAVDLGRYFPSSPSWLSRTLRAEKSSLECLGIHMEADKHTHRDKIVRFTLDSKEISDDEGDGKSGSNEAQDDDELAF